MFCSKCGQAVADGAQFCSHCGTATATATAPVPPPVEPIAASPAKPAAVFAAAVAPPQPDPQQSPHFASGFVSPGLVARVKGMLLAPTTEWATISAESAPASAIYLQYVAPLAAIGVVAALIGQSIVGVGVPFLGTYRTPFVSALAFAMLSYALTFGAVFLVALLVDALAPTFGGQRDSLRALKVTAYSYTPAWVAGVLHVIPALGIVGVIAGLYGIYLLYLGLPVMMRCPKEKAIGYSAVVLICALVLSVVIGSISALAIGGLGFRHFGAGGALSQGRADDRAATDAAAGLLSGIFGGKTPAERQRVGDAMQELAKMGQQAEQAEKAAKANGSSDSQRTTANAVDAGAALGALGQIITGGANVQPVDFHKLKEMLPESVAGMKRNDSAAESTEAMGIKGASATAHYSNDAGGRVTVEIVDLGSLSGLAGMATRFDPNIQKETDTGYERTTKVNGQLLHERYDRQSKSGEASILTGDRFSITVSGSGVDADVLVSTLKTIDIGQLAKLAAATK
jgi:Yip1 domain/zinc-ribbon domain